MSPLRICLTDTQKHLTSNKIFHLHTYLMDLLQPPSRIFAQEGKGLPASRSRTQARAFMQKKTFCGVHYFDHKFRICTVSGIHIVLNPARSEISMYLIWAGFTNRQWQAISQLLGAAFRTRISSLRSTKTDSLAVGSG